MLVPKLIECVALTCSIDERGPTYSSAQRPLTMENSTRKSCAPDLWLEWDHIDTVLLDLDGTLLDLNFDNHFWKIHVPKRYAERNAMSFEQACSKIYPHMMAIRGTLDWYSIHYWSNYLDLDIVALKTEMRHLIKLRPGVVEFLTALRDHNKFLVLTTNAHPDTLSIKFAQVPLAAHFDEVVTSHRLGAPKENLNFWRSLSERIYFNPSRSMLIDDHPGVLTAAREFGVSVLLTIHQPDLNQPAQPENGFDAVFHFDHISPGKLA